MKTKYKHTVAEADKVKKYGIDLVIYNENVPEANVVHVSSEEGHFEEFYSKRSWFIYYVVEGEGIFVLNDEKIEVQPTDLITIPPKTRIYYFGKMKMVLTVAPAFDEKDEVHVRMVDKAESPYFGEKE